MLTNSDWTSFAADIAAIRGDNEVSLILRRGDSTLAAQSARVAGRGMMGQRQANGQTQEARTAVTVLFAVGADAQPEDRFTLNGRLYRIVAIKPNTRVGVMADAVQEE